MATLERKVIVGVTQRVDDIDGRSERRDALDQKLIEWIVDAGFLPVPIPNMLFNAKNSSVIDTWLQTQQLNALVLSGGNNIGDYAERDGTEKYLLYWAELNNLPVLGVCRGMQMMAVWAGAKLTPVKGHVRTHHELILKSPMNGWPRVVNSYHDWSLLTCPEHFEVVAKAEDGNIEAICHQTLPWEGWMWHPEREQPFCTEDTIRIKRLFNAI